MRKQNSRKQPEVRRSFSAYGQAWAVFDYDKRMSNKI